MALGAASAPSAAEDQPFSLSLFGSYTTTSKVFFRPKDPDEFLRSQFFSLDGIFSAGLDLRSTFPPGNLQIGLSAEILSRSNTSHVPFASLSVPVVDGVTAIPVEATGYFFIPVGTEAFRVYMGGGTGIYFGSRRYEYGGTRAEAVERSAGFGIHIVSGVEWFVTPLISMRTGIKFRDVQFETVNRFLRPATIYQGTIIPLPADPIASRINIDGMHLSVGLAYHW